MNSTGHSTGLSLFPPASPCSPPRLLAHPERITLVDDVITRGSSFVGMVPRIHEAYPDAAVRCFALIRTISTGEVLAIFAPTAGIITYRNGLLLRQP